MEGQDSGISGRRSVRRLWLERLAPWGLFSLKVLVSVYCLYVYIPRYIRLTYIADGPARGIEAYNLASGDFGIFQTYQFLPLQLWLWAGLLKIYPDIYWTGTALNIAAAAGTTVLLYFLGRELAGPVAAAPAAEAPEKERFRAPTKEKHYCMLGAGYGPPHQILRPRGSKAIPPITISSGASIFPH